MNYQSIVDEIRESIEKNIEFFNILIMNNE